MTPRLADTPALEPPAAARPGAARAGGAAKPISGAGFAAALRDVRGDRVTVARGDTLTSIVRARWQALGGPADGLDARQAHRWALQVAADNGLSDPNRILPGQQLQVRDPAPEARVAAGAAAPTGTPPRTDIAAAGSAAGSRVDAAVVAPPGAVGAAAAELAPVLLQSMRQAGSALMGQTLDRAVHRGFIPAGERQAVQARIEALADKHGFRPDDFARTVLMESDGLNPQANNGRCFGIIQFCAGPDRGAASAGYAHQPQAILRLSVLEQLDLVDRYFDDTRLRDFRGGDGAVRLDDLYLTILTPAARQERRLTAPLSIAGTQALDLHTGRNRAQPITRASILSGLHAVARERLGQFSLARGPVGE